MFHDVTWSFETLGTKATERCEDRKFLKCSPFFHRVHEINDTICTMKPLGRGGKSAASSHFLSGGGGGRLPN